MSFKWKQMVGKLPGNVSGKSGNCLVFCKMCIIQRKILANAGAKWIGIEIFGKKVLKMQAHPARLPSFSEILETFPIPVQSTRKCCSTCHQKFLIDLKVFLDLLLLKFKGADGLSYFTILLLFLFSGVLPTAIPQLQSC